MKLFLINTLRTLAVCVPAVVFATDADAQIHRNFGASSSFNTSSSSSARFGSGNNAFSVSDSVKISSSASANMNGATRTFPNSFGFPNSFALNGAFRNVGTTGERVTPFAAQAALNNYNGAGTLSSFYYHSPYSNSLYGSGFFPGYASLYGGYGLGGYGLGGGYGGYGGYGGGGGTYVDNSQPLPTSNGAAVEPASSGVMQDDIARQQANFQGAFQNVDLAERRLQLKKATFDEAMYEKMNTPPAEFVREEYRQQRLARARNTPPAAEIASGDALNELLTNIQRIQARQPIAGNMVRLDPEAVARINVTTTDDLRGSNELFKAGALSRWPTILAGDNFAAERKNLMAAIVDAARGQANGSVNDAKTAEAKRLVDSIKDKLFGGRFDASFTDYVNAIAFLNKLSDTVNILGKQDAANYLNGTYAAKGDTVAQLADHMISHGLKFAKATAGDEPHYANLYQQIVAYEIDLSRKAEQAAAKQVRAPSN